MTRAAAAVIRAQMNVLQITQADLVRDTSMSQPMMSHLLKGHNVFDLAQLDEVCALLKINPADVLVHARENATSHAPRHQEK